MTVGPNNSIAMFRALIGCDPLSSNGGGGKEMARDTWKVCDDFTEAFCALACTLFSGKEWLMLLKRFVVLIYDHTSSEPRVNEQLFTHEGRLMGIPPNPQFYVRGSGRILLGDGAFAGPH